MDVGKQFGSLTAVRRLQQNKRGEYLWQFTCVCGNGYEAAGTVIKRQVKISANPDVPSCGCINKQVATKLATKHGYAYDPLYKLYYDMHQRCYNKNNTRYSLYGGEGVTVCEEWLNHVEVFIEWVLKNGYTPGLQLDKDILCDSLGIKPKIYAPHTCQFITLKENIKHSASRTTARKNSKRIKIFQDDANIIRELYRAGGISQDKLAAKYGVSQATIWYIINTP